MKHTLSKTLSAMVLSCLTFSSSFGQCEPSLIESYVNVNGGEWSQSSSVTADQGADIQFGPQPVGGSWSWSGPNGYSSSVREAVITNIPKNGEGTYTATYTNDCGAQSSQSWQISVNDGTNPNPNPGCNPEPITPYVKIGRSEYASETASAFFINIGDEIDFGPQPVGGSWSWSGPNGFSASTREISLVIDELADAGTYTATYTSDCGTQLTQDFDLTFRPRVASWDDFVYPTITFENQVPGTAATDIFTTVFPNIQETMRGLMLEVLKTLYADPNDAIRSFNSLNIALVDDPNTVAYASGNSLEKTVGVGFSFVQDIYNDNGRSYDAVRRELEGVLVHEATHLFQWEPKNAGDYDGSSVFWAFIEGEGDGVRALLRNWVPTRFPSVGGNWNDGYERTGFFLKWCYDNKSSDFFVDINKYAREASTFTWDGAFQSILGQGVQEVWNEYQNSLRPSRRKALASDLDATSELSVYPNPMTDVLNIDLEGKIESTVADIYSINGSKVLTQYLSSNSSKIDVSILPKGAYIVVVNQNGNAVQKKLVK